MAGAGYRGRLENFARKARVKLIEAVSRQAALYGLTEKEALPVTVTGSVATIGGRSFPAGVAEMQRELAQRIRRHGYARVIDEVAYTWFNRFAAIRYMELHGLLAHGYRVLSHPQRADGLPEILEHARELELPGLDKARVDELLMAGGREAELYQLLIVAHCNSLHEQMPFLFEAVHEASELLLPDRLLHTGSVMRAFVEELDEGDWQEIEVIGWLYQYYISEKKDAVIGSVVKSEDIPAATQLFTPNWIVKYMVQNSLGRQWMLANPDSGLRAGMTYYIEPGEQPPEAERTMRESIPKGFEPESITLLDPACGSGHILVEAYSLFRSIYLERGYLPREIPKLILEKNLFGLEIDERAAQLASFALMMKARADDPRLFERHVRPNILAIRESNEVNREQTLQALMRRYDGKPVIETGEFGFAASEAMPLFFQNAVTKATSGSEGFSQADAQALTSLLDLFKDAQTYGSLLRVPDSLVKKLPDLTAQLTSLLRQVDDMNERHAAESTLPFLWQAGLLAKRYSVVVANPPYMGGGGMNALVKEFAKKEYPDSKSDLCTMFIERNGDFAEITSGLVAMITMQSWMFLSSFEKLRATILNRQTILSMLHLGAHAFDSIGGEVVSTTSFVLHNNCRPNYRGVYLRLVGGDSESEKQLVLRKIVDRLSNEGHYFAGVEDFKKIPSTPIAYWVKGTHLFEQKTIRDVFISGGRNKTHDNEKYVRFFWEVPFCDHDWVSYANGGDFRKYAGNELYVVNWSDEARAYYAALGGLCNPKFWGKEGITWSLITTARNSFRIKPKHMQYSSGSPTIFNDSFTCDKKAIAFLNSPISIYYLKAINPTINTTVSDVFALPYLDDRISARVGANADKCILISKVDWDSYETSRDFTSYSLLSLNYRSPALKTTFQKFYARSNEITLEMQRLEEENNRIFIDAYGLQNEVYPDVPLQEITLTCNPVYRYGKGKTESEYEELQRRDTVRELISYAIGCMMGRYSLDVPGLVYAESGNEGFDASRYATFPADEDGILPLTEEEWFEDEAANRFQRFLRTTFGDEHAEENLRFVADALGVRADHPLQAVRRYLANDFFKDHLRTYKKRPIYWLFSSGKERAFQCLVYLHRYNEGTLARMRTQYLIPLQGKIRMRIEQLEGDEGGGQKPAGAAGRRSVRELDTLRKQADELRSYDEQMRHYADMRIRLDLDDGVKVNYGKFGTLLANVKDVTGSAE